MQMKLDGRRTRTWRFGKEESAARGGCDRGSGSDPPAPPSNQPGYERNLTPHHHLDRGLQDDLSIL